MLFLVSSFSLNGMEEAVEPWILHSSFRYSKTYIDQTRIYVAKGHVSKADGIVDIIVGSTRSDLENKKIFITPRSHCVHFDIQYGRYCFDYEKGRHKEGVVTDSLDCSCDDSSICIDREEQPQEVKKSLEWIYLQVLSDAKKDYPEAKRIALSSLGTEKGFPTKMVIPVAVKTIGDFIRANPGAYSEIFLFVKKQSLITEYLKCIEKYKKYLEYRELFE